MNKPEFMHTDSFKSDAEVKREVEAELRRDPTLNAARIAVAVADGDATLSGYVDSYPERAAAEEAARRVGGVRWIAQELEVKLPDDLRRSDRDLALAVESALRWNVLVPGTVTSEVCQGEVTLHGTVNWDFQRHAAGRAVRAIKGVVGVCNAIALEVHDSTAEVRGRIESALQRQATTDTRSIQVDAIGSVVTLSGHASSWQMVRAATDAAWSTPGVTEVNAKLHVTIPRRN